MLLEVLICRHTTILRERSLDVTLSLSLLISKLSGSSVNSWAIQQPCSAGFVCVQSQRLNVLTLWLGSIGMGQLSESKEKHGEHCRLQMQRRPCQRQQVSDGSPCISSVIGILSLTPFLALCTTGSKEFCSISYDLSMALDEAKSWRTLSRITQILIMYRNTLQAPMYQIQHWSSVSWSKNIQTLLWQNTIGLRISPWKMVLIW